MPETKARIPWRFYIALLTFGGSMALLGGVTLVMR